jgi:hypothetical protein
VHGQPAWTSERKDGATTIVTLALPWANALVTAQSPGARTAHALLQRVSVRVTASLDVASSATSVFIQSLAGHDGDGLQRNVRITAQSDVRRLLTELRSLPVVTASSEACGGSWPTDTALVTVQTANGTHTYAARFDACGLVVGGTGVAARSSATLLADIRRLVPNSGL